MAYYDYHENKIIHYPPIKSIEHPGWEQVDCGCCDGIEWGGEEPNECHSCGGGGFIWHHIKSGVYAEYPGGRFTGKDSKK